MNARTAAGVALLALGIGFNIPYSVLASTFDYPGVLRLPAGEILARFAAGGPGLVLTWYAFMLTALLLSATAALLAVAERNRPSAAMTGTIGVAAGLLQAIGLSRWVFAVPALAAAHADPAATEATRAGIEAAFAALHAFAGVAIGEHLGQLLTAAWVVGVASGQRSALRGLGVAAAALIVAGTGEGLALGLGRDGGLFSLATIAGFLVLTLWLLGTGAALLHRPAPEPRQAAAARA
ncbi:MAG: DUF4386 family protein [Alphaproteobacteria bacterium]|nr:DUF4386 family protein [Alphaproteobacteria bacterium]